MRARELKDIAMEARRRRPPISPERWKVLEPMIDAVVERSPAQRDAFLLEISGGDRALRAELELLLAEYGRGDALLDQPAAERFASIIDAEPPVPAILNGRYRIECEIGRGGMAIVYLAHDVRHDRKVAVKILHRELAAAVGAERFLAEIRITAQLQHPHILPLYDSGEAEGCLYYVMPYVHGESLRQRLEREAQLPIEEAARIAHDAASALAAAHRTGVIHRDIKPENILLHDGSALVADFGIALAVNAAATRRRTHSGFVVGTPQYMSPEQSTGGHAIDSRCDVYALGAVLYEMLAGEPPFTGATGGAIFAKRLGGPAPRVRVLRAAVPAALDAAVARALALEPADRFRTVEEFAAAVDTAVATSAWTETASPRGAARRSRPSFVFAVALSFVVAAGGVALLARSRSDVVSPTDRLVTAAKQSIAVLPLKSVGSDTANRYFAEGMTDELSSALGKVTGLRVVPGRDAAYLAKGEDIDPAEVGRSLRVGMLLQGTVRLADSDLIVVVDLVNASDGSLLWTDRYSRQIRDARDLFGVQDEIARGVVGQLTRRLGVRDVAAPTQQSTESLKALMLYLQGRGLFDQRKPEELQKALGYFQQAIATDSNYAQAYSGVADVYSSYAIGNVGDFAPNEYFPMARAAGQRALALDSTSSDAHTSLGVVKLFYEYDWQGAEREFDRALALDSHSSMARVYRIVFREFTRRFDDAVAESRDAMDANPLSLFVNTESGRALFFDRRYDDAIAQLRETLERDSTQFRAHLLLGQVFEQKAMLDSAITHMEAAVIIAPGSSRTHAYLAHALALAGRLADARRELHVLQERSRTRYVPAFDFAVVYAGLGQIENVFGSLEKSIDEHSLRPYLMDPTFDSIRSDARYEELLRRLTLSPPRPPE